MFHLEQVTDLAAQALDDAGLKASDLDGLVISGPQFHEAEAMFYGKPLNAEDVLASKKVADPLHVLEIVMPVAGGMSQVIEAFTQISGRADQRQLKKCDQVFVSGTDGDE